MNTTDLASTTKAASTQLPKSSRNHLFWETESDAHSDTWHKRQLRAIAWPVRRAISDCLLPVAHRLQMTLAELRSCWQRIRIESRRPAGLDPSLCLGPILVLDNAGHLQPCSRTQTCTRDIEALQADYPWTTDFDRRVFLRGWRAGAEWGMAQSDEAASVDSCNEQPERIQAQSASSASNPERR